MLRRKRNARNEVKRYKARLVILDNLQRKGEIGDIYSSVVKYATVRAVLAIAAARDLELRQGDVTAAFLGGKLNEDQVVYMMSLKKMNLSSDKVLKIMKSIYELRISSLI